MTPPLRPPPLDLSATTTTAKHHAILSGHQKTGPPSPTHSTASFMSSVSWMAEKSSAELIPMLKNAYAALKDKERDLMLAAEIGKSLLENNIQLKSVYEDLLNQTKNSVSLTEPLLTPTNSLATVHEHNGEALDDDDDASMRFVPSRRTRDAMIEVLEHQNAELTRKLEMALAEQESSDRLNVRRTNKLQTEIETLRSSLELAATKIQELEEMNRRQRHIEQTVATVSKETQKDNKAVDELLQKIDTLEAENDAINRSKADLEEKLKAALIDLNKLKDQFETFQFTQKDYESIQEAYQRQFKHIAELNASLEEHRNHLQRLKERGVDIHSSPSTPTPSLSGSESQPARHTLLGELESEWLKRKQSTSTLRTSISSFSLPKALSFNSQPLHDLSQFTEKSLAAFYSAPTEMALDTVLAGANHFDRELLDEALSFIGHLEKEHESSTPIFSEPDDDADFELFGPPIHRDNYPAVRIYPDPDATFEIDCVTRAPKTFLDRLRRLVRRFFRAVWCWCRFAMILTTAVLISVWQGPKGLIEY